MEDRNNILPLLGLALRGGHLAVGEEPCEAAARAKDARVLLVASDAADNTVRRVKHFALEGACIWLSIPFAKADLGRAVGRSAAAIVAVTDIGLANAVVHRLEELDPAKYGEAAQRLEIKARRAQQRKAEQRAHEKNVRTGKYKAKKAVPAEEATPQPVQQEKAKEAAKPYRKPRSSKENRPKPRAKINPYAHSRPVKKGKGSFRKKED